MKTAVMFSGVDALDDKVSRLKAQYIPEVINRITQAQSILEKYQTNAPNLLDFLKSDDSYFHSNLPLKALLCAVVQVGLYDRYVKFNSKPSYLVGYSLGDTARTACSGAFTFEEMIYGTYLFNVSGQRIDNGATVFVSSKQPFNEVEIKHIEESGLTVGVHQTPKHVLVSGPKGLLELWVKNTAPQMGYKTFKMYDKPLHSIYMSPALSSIKKSFEMASPKEASIPMISTVFTKLIRSEEDLRLDIEQNMIGTVNWWQTFKWMAEILRVDKFINIGPNSTLMRFADRIPLERTVIVSDSLAHDIDWHETIIPSGMTGPLGAQA